MPKKDAARSVSLRVLWLPLLTWLAFAPQLAKPDVVVPPLRADLFSLRVAVNVAFDPESGLYTYEYSIENRSDSQQNVDSFHLLSGAIVSDVMSPKGWTFSAFDGSVGAARRAIMGWAATEIGPLPPDFVDDGNLVEGPFTIKPGVTLTGFSFTSAAAPGTVTYYSQGFTKMPQVDGDAADIMEGGFDLTLLDFTQNSVSGSIEAPVEKCDADRDDGRESHLDREPSATP